MAAEPEATADSLKPGNGFTDQAGHRRPQRDVTLGGKAPAENDTLLLAYPDDPDTVNPITANDTVSEELMRQVYESLAERKFSNPDIWQADAGRVVAVRSGESANTRSIFARE